MSSLSSPERTRRVCRAAARLCGRLGWAPLLEVPLPSGRRLDILALEPDGGLTAIEVKSGARDFQSDEKWPEYRSWCDRLFFAVDLDFPQALLPAEAGLIVCDEAEAVILRQPEEHRLPAARRKALTLRYARLAAGRLQGLLDPAGASEMRAALKVE
ncbi:MmcB family DNA repair protein [Roseomonas sp. GC11]|uniref:MmcB family DNA repair protein n=1 Tax=Roseomonas sp. GC11 TaxID=2950546 RepID=UPI00210D87F6|nr:MmcB family DNA repair protein [Roseomonas sp. GC11]MCQ4159783.1 MmcB family DNA repair protein [Roseomonas sp. GC11]